MKTKEKVLREWKNEIDRRAKKGDWVLTHANFKDELRRTKIAIDLTEKLVREDCEKEIFQGKRIGIDEVWKKHIIDKECSRIRDGVTELVKAQEDEHNPDTLWILDKVMRIIDKVSENDRRDTR